MESKASAVWNGSLREGTGAISLESGVLEEVPYTFKSRFEGERGTNPEELIAAAHSACFSMALSAELGRLQITPEEIRTQATVSLSQDGPGFSVTASNLVTTVKAPGADEAKIQLAAETAKENCPISKLLKAEISLQLTIEA